MVAATTLFCLITAAAPSPFDGVFVDAASGDVIEVRANAEQVRLRPRRGSALSLQPVERSLPARVQVLAPADKPDQRYRLEWDETVELLTVTRPDGAKQTFKRRPPPPRPAAGDIYGGIVLRDGRILLSYDNSSGRERAGSALFDPRKVSWKRLPRVGERAQSSWILLPDGRVLVTMPGAPCQLFDPRDDSVRPTGETVVPRLVPALAVLGDGRVLAAGGEEWQPNQVPNTVASAEIWSSSTGKWEPTGELKQPRRSAIAVTLADGRVLVAAGMTPGAAGKLERTAETEIFDPRSGTWSSAGQMSRRRVNAALARLEDGRVLAMGGDDGGVETDSVDIFDPATGQWTPTGALGHPRTAVVALPLKDGGAIVLDGWTSGISKRDPSTELFDAKTATWKPGPKRVGKQSCRTAGFLADGRIICAFGEAPGSDRLQPPELLDLAKRKWTAGRL